MPANHAIKTEPGTVPTADYSQPHQAQVPPFFFNPFAQRNDATLLQQQIAMLQAQLAMQQQVPHAPYSGYMYPQANAMAPGPNSSGLHHSGSYPGSASGSGAGGA